jgi:hypothetical protein
MLKIIQDTMKNKTALQELMEWMIEESEVIPVDPGDVYQKAKELLPKEKEQIIASWENGFWEGCEEELSGNSGLQYYNEQYEK